MTESLRAMEVMGVPNADQRRSPRRSVHAGGTISAGDATYVAWIKDISETGICLFSKHQPEPGDHLRVTLNDTGLPANLRKSFEGRVVRVQRSGPGAAVVGIVFGMVTAAFFRAA